MIISVAAGTSTPTSMTVVATSSWTLPWAKAFITRSLSAVAIRPWMRPTRTSGSASASAAAVGSAASDSRCSDSSISGHTQ